MVVEECSLAVKLKLCINGQTVEVELDRENAEKLRAKLTEALGPPQPQYVPYPVTYPYPVYTPPVWVEPRPWWSGSLVTYCSNANTGNIVDQSLPAFNGELQLTVEN